MHFVAFVAVLILTVAVHGQQTLQVPAQFASIQDAINAAQNGDTVLVAAGTYVEHIDFIGKAIKVQSVAGSQQTTISGGNGPGRVVSFLLGESSDAVLDGFRITGAYLPEYIGPWPPPPAPSTGGIECSGSSPIIRRCMIDSNSTRLNEGAGILIFGGAPIIEDTTISGNHFNGPGIGSTTGGGVCISGPAQVTIQRCKFFGNSANLGGGIAMRNECTVTIESCRVSANHSYGDPGGLGAGIAVSASFGAIQAPVVAVRSTLIAANTCNGCAPSGAGVYSTAGVINLTNCTIVANTVFDMLACGGGGAAGIGFGLFGGGQVSAVNCVVWGNLGGYQVFGPPVWGPSNLPTWVPIDHCCVQGITGSGSNSGLDPQFVNTTDYRLSATSPCRDSGTIQSAIVSASDDMLDPRIIGAAIDIGADEYPISVAGAGGTALDGNVGAEAGSLTDVLFINGSPGDNERRLSVGVGTAGTLLIASPIAWGPTPFVLMADVSPGYLLTPFPMTHSILSFEPPLPGASDTAVFLASSIGLSGGLTNLVPPAPSLFMTAGLPTPGEILVQAVVIDPNGRLLTTNGVRLTIQ